MGLDFYVTGTYCVDMRDADKLAGLIDKNAQLISHIAHHQEGLAAAKQEQREVVAQIQALLIEMGVRPVPRKQYSTTLGPNLGSRVGSSAHRVLEVLRAEAASDGGGRPLSAKMIVERLGAGTKRRNVSMDLYRLREIGRIERVERGQYRIAGEKEG